MKKLFFSLFVACGFLIASCGDDNGPTLTITSETNLTLMAVDSSFTIEGSATDDTGISSITFVGKDNFTINESFDISSAPDKTNIPFVVTISGLNGEAGDYELEVTATDEDGNTDSETIEITLQ